MKPKVLLNVTVRKGLITVNSFTGWRSGIDMDATVSEALFSVISENCRWPSFKSKHQ